MPNNETRDKQVPEIADDIYFSWEIDERPHFHRGAWWYFTAIFLGVVFLLYSIFTANFLLAIIVILVAFILIVRDYLPSRKLSFEIGTRGIYLDNRFVDYKELSSFYLVYEPPHFHNLYFEFKGVRPDLSIDMEGLDPIELRDFLLQFLDENLEKEDISTLDFWERFLKL